MKGASMLNKFAIKLICSILIVNFLPGILCHYNFSHTIFGQTTEENFLQKAATNLGIELSELKINREDLEFYGYGKYRLKIFDTFIYNPVKISALTRTISKTILNNSDSLWALAYFPWARIDEGVRRGLLGHPSKILFDTLNKITNRKEALMGLLMNDFGVDSIEFGNPSDTLVFGLLLLLAEISKGFRWINNATNSITSADIDTIIEGLINEREDGLSNKKLEKLIESTDFKSLAAGAMDLCYVIQTALGILKTTKPDAPFVLKTKYGKIIIGTNKNDRYEEPPYLLIIDFGGNDYYESCAVTNKDNPVSIVIDFEGNDIYKGTIGPGSGICGYGFVVDSKGNDNYVGERLGLATGIFGEGIILDLAGDDNYSVELYGEGAGLFGTGILSDLDGNDLYMGFQGIQGFGFVKGAGILIDRQGSDIYIARDDTVKFPSSQTKEHNVSLSQGMGFGIRADFTDGHSLAGGIGMLIDGKGNDKYSCGVFGQGCGYWYGTGFLIDYEGNDEYDGIWYVQGSGAHFAIGVLIDSTGDDRFRATKNMAQGAGHDFTLGYLLDYRGNDYHDAPNLSLGGGNANGMGLFIDCEGSDEYVTHGGITLGNASTASRGSIRDYMKTIGIFIDAKGLDRYTEPSAKNHQTWQQKSQLEPPLPTEKFIGIDF